VPEGVELADAAEVVPETEILRYPNGSYALFSNRFRYALQAKGLGTWVDCDAYLLRPLDSVRPCLVGEYEPGRFDTGVLRLPGDSPLIEPLLALFGDREVPSWLPWRSRLRAYGRRLRRGRSGIEAMPWGTTGPKALTALIHRLRVDVDPLPPDVLYPVRWQDAAWVFDPEATLADRISPATVSVHLWNERIRHRKARPAAPGSFMARLQAEGA
jgi:hypothetical protein